MNTITTTATEPLTDTSPATEPVVTPLTLEDLSLVGGGEAMPNFQ